MERPTRESVNIRIAQIISERGTCARMKVGAVITNKNRIISTGYNGPAKDKAHCGAFVCNTDNPCRRAIHAEDNALFTSGLDFFDGNKYRDENLILYCTHQPCAACAKIILKYSIGIIYYIHEYRDKSGIELLENSGVKIYRLDEQGNPQ